MAASAPAPHLLKACIGYIQRREFDPGASSNITAASCLGVVAGGMVVLLIENLSVASSATTDLHVSATTAVHVSAAALGLLAGYNTDFLFPGDRADHGRHPAQGGA